MATRLIIACSHCRRQYSVAQQASGQRVHCHCGQAIEIHEPNCHDAAIVACSSCGAPREQQTLGCGHCGADFTLHELDLDTICPGCYARISRRARYCHHCSLRIASEPIRKRDSQSICPACSDEKHLSHRLLGERHVAVLECQRCAGLWLPIERFEALIDEEARRERAPRGPEPAAYQLQTGRLYRPCVVCRDLMVRQNFGDGKSRVIIDICGEHGVWFDNDELAQLLAWVRDGGATDARRDLARIKGAKDLAQLRRFGDSSPTKTSSIQSSAEDHDAGIWPLSTLGIVEGVLRLLFDKMFLD